MIEKCIKHGSLKQRQRILAEVMLGNEELEKEVVDDESPLALMMKDQYATMLYRSSLKDLIQRAKKRESWW